MHSNEMNDITEATAGDIVALFGVECASGDTFTNGDVSVTMTSMHVPDAVISLAVAPKDRTALANFSKALSKEVGPRGIRVNTISPGPVSTDLWLGDGGVAATLGLANARAPEEIAKQAAADSVTGRFTSPQEVAALVLLLASDRAGNVTGADFAIDGGMTTSL